MVFAAAIPIVWGIIVVIILPVPPAEAGVRTALEEEAVHHMTERNAMKIQITHIHIVPSMEFPAVNSNQQFT